ncbi:MAG TPA: hypothetical protein VFA46_18490 [Actinomycetes bacterium]|nr:hypothetical protein [Actinomycetes bacterium]
MNETILPEANFAIMMEMSCFCQLAQPSRTGLELRGPFVSDAFRAIAGFSWQTFEFTLSGPFTTSREYRKEVDSAGEGE